MFCMGTQSPTLRVNGELNFIHTPERGASSKLPSHTEHGNEKKDVKLHLFGLVGIIGKVCQLTLAENKFLSERE